MLIKTVPDINYKLLILDVQDFEHIKVINNDKDHRFEINLNDKLAFIPYHIKDDLIELFHTEVPNEYSGRGIGTRLALYALNFAKDHHLKILLYCPFILKYIRQHPEWMLYIKRVRI